MPERGLKLNSYPRINNIHALSLDLEGGPIAGPIAADLTGGLAGPIAPRVGDPPGLAEPTGTRGEDPAGLAGPTGTGDADLAGPAGPIGPTGGPIGPTTLLFFRLSSLPQFSTAFLFSPPPSPLLNSAPLSFFLGDLPYLPPAGSSQSFPLTAVR